MPKRNDVRMRSATRGRVAPGFRQRSPLPFGCPPPRSRRYRWHRPGSTSVGLRSQHGTWTPAPEKSPRLATPWSRTVRVHSCGRQLTELCYTRLRSPGWLRSKSTAPRAHSATSTPSQMCLLETHTFVQMERWSLGPRMVGRTELLRESTLPRSALTAVSKTALRQRPTRDQAAESTRGRSCARMDHTAIRAMSTHRAVMCWCVSS